MTGERIIADMARSIGVPHGERPPTEWELAKRLDHAEYVRAGSTADWQICLAASQEAIEESNQLLALLYGHGAGFVEKVGRIVAVVHGDERGVLSLDAVHGLWRAQSPRPLHPLRPLILDYWNRRD